MAYAKYRGDFVRVSRGLGDDPRDVGRRPQLRPPPKRDPQYHVQPGELLDIETDGQRLLRLAGKPVGPYVEADGLVFYPRRNGEVRHQPLSDKLALARVLCK